MKGTRPKRNFARLTQHLTYSEEENPSATSNSANPGTAYQCTCRHNFQCQGNLTHYSHFCDGHLPQPAPKNTAFNCHCGRVFHRKGVLTRQYLLFRGSTVFVDMAYCLPYNGNIYNVLQLVSDTEYNSPALCAHLRHY